LLVPVTGLSADSKSDMICYWTGFSVFDGSGLQSCPYHVCDIYDSITRSPTAARPRYVARKKEANMRDV
jgi:glutamine synthetase